MTYVRLARGRSVDSVYAHHPAVIWQAGSAPADMVALVADPQHPDDPDYSWIVFDGTGGRYNLERAVYAPGEDKQHSEWTTVDEAIGHVLGGGR